MKIHATQPVFSVPLCSGSALDTDREVVNGHQAALSYTWEIMLTKKRTMLNDPIPRHTHTKHIVGRMRASLTDDLRDDQSLHRITISQQHTDCAEEPKPIKRFEKVFHKFEVDSSLTSFKRTHPSVSVDFRWKKGWRRCPLRF